MQDIIKALSSQRTLSTKLKGASLEQLDKIVTNLLEYQEERQKEAQRQAEIEAQEQQELEQIKQQIVEKGLDFDKLVSLMGSAKKRKPSARKSKPSTPSSEPEGQREEVSE
ncbi:H-NS family histone-like protein [Vibrio sp. WXL210]|uniref:H-NS family histone-like protein n=1 Tax=Vibrio sp. WXL210 TaxID=3450709 RepID=UPI003EC5804C